jgi:hypothetical protein
MSTPESSEGPGKNLTPKKGTKPPGWVEAFLATLRTTGNVRSACKQAGIARQTAYERRESDAEFRHLWDDALQEALDELEEAGRERAKLASDVLLIFFLKHHRPHVYNPDAMTAREAAALGESLAALAAEFIPPERHAEFRSRAAMLLK